MGKTVFIDGASGASGDMVLGALIDAGVPLDVVRGALGGLAALGVSIDVERVQRAGVGATKCHVRVHGRRADPAPAELDVHPYPGGDAHSHHEQGRAGHPHAHHASHHHDAPSQASHRHAHDAQREPSLDGIDTANAHPSGGHAASPQHAHGTAGHAPDHHHGDPTQSGAGAPQHEHHHRGLSAVLALIADSGLSEVGKARAGAWMRRLAEAEAAVHGTDIEHVHFHEVGALDSIADVIGIVAAFEHLRADRVVCAPLNVGAGTVRCAHGVYPVPAPATLRLVVGVPTYSAGPSVELLTPTGALALTGIADGFGPQPLMRTTAIGYGAGDRQFDGWPNALRVMVGESDEAHDGVVTVLECELDDITGEVLGDVMERVLAAGAFDVFFTPVQMKKHRPGTLLTVLAPPTCAAALRDLLFTETTTLGVRYHDVRRECVARAHEVVSTAFGDIRVKVGTRNGRVVSAAPEFEDCRRAARERHVPVKHVYAAAHAAWLQRAPYSE